jgi:hypothetical protein
MVTVMTATTAPQIHGSRCPGGPGRHQRLLRLGFNILVNVLVLTGLCLGVVHMAGRRLRRSCPRSASSC